MTVFKVCVKLDVSKTIKQIAPFSITTSLIIQNVNFLPLIMSVTFYMYDLRLTDY